MWRVAWRDNAILSSKTGLRLIVHRPVRRWHFWSNWTLMDEPTVPSNCVLIIGSISTQWRTHTTRWLKSIVRWCARQKGATWFARIERSILHSTSNWGLRCETLLSHQCGLVAWANWVSLTDGLVWHMTCLLLYRWHMLRRRWHPAIKRVLKTRMATIGIHVITPMVMMWLNLTRRWCHCVCLLVTRLHIAVSIWTWSLWHLMRVVILLSHHLFCLLHWLMMVIDFLALSLSSRVLLIRLGLLQLLLPTALKSIKKILWQPIIIELSSKCFNCRLNYALVESGRVNVNVYFFDLTS